MSQKCIESKNPGQIANGQTTGGQNAGQNADQFWDRVDKMAVLSNH